MKKIYFLITFFIFNFFFSQTNYVLKLKFNEKHFLSSFIRNNTKNEFVLNAFRKADSITQNSLNYNYVNILDSVLKNEFKISEKEKLNLSDLERKQRDSLFFEMQNGNLLSLYKKIVEVNFDSEFLEKILIDNEIRGSKITQTDYNQFTISLINKENLEKTKTIFLNHRLSFHEVIDKTELEKIQNCFFNENENLVKNNYLKKENNHLLIYKDVSIPIFDYYQNTKCFDSRNVTFLLNEGKDFDIFSKLFFVKKSDNLENNLINSVEGFYFEGHKNEEIYEDNLFYISLFLNDNGKNILLKFTEKNVGKKVFIGDKNEFLLSPSISDKLKNGRIVLKGNLFDVNWQRIYELVKFEVFRNSLEIK